MTAGLTSRQRATWAVALEGPRVRLEPMSGDDIRDLHLAGSDPALWQWTVSSAASLPEMAAYVEEALGEFARGVSIPFVTKIRATGEVAGSTRFGNIDTRHRRLEIGWTWLAPKWHRTFVNTEVKYVMLRHAFEVMDCGRVELKTDARNTRSRTAIARLGAVEEGTLRHHMVTSTGRIRDTVYYSILSSEWPDVKVRLEEQISRWRPTR